MVHENREKSQNDWSNALNAGCMLLKTLPLSKEKSGIARRSIEGIPCEEIISDV
jgi:hypothetical protein